MENTCMKCGGELVSGVLAGRYGLCFYVDGEMKKLRPKKMSRVICDCCKVCGMIQNMRATEIEKLK